VVSARWAIRAASVAVVLAGVACRPDLNQTLSIVSTPQILAVKSEPAQAPPKVNVTYTALVVDSFGALDVPVDWAFCNARKPLAELGPVSPQCLQLGGDWFVPIGVGTQATGAVPAIACKQFGPEVPQPLPHQPPGRPVDPDPTGGYYQPLRVVVPSRTGDVLGVGETRLSCGLAGTPDQVVEFNHHFTPNANPAIESLTAGGAPLSTDDKGVTNPVHGGESLVLSATWASCPQATGVCGDGYCDLGEDKQSCPADCATLASCTGAETYVVLDLNTHQLVTQREGMEAAWFATGGSFDNDRTGRDSHDSANDTPNRWRAPATAGVVHMWVVLRDDRGGVGWSGYVLDVR
jgi:hypothetical protein